MKNHSHLLALPLVLWLGATSATAQPTPERVETNAILNAEADAFMEWALEDPG